MSHSTQPPTSGAYSINLHATFYDVTAMLRTKTGKTSYTGDQILAAMPHLKALLTALGVEPFTGCYAPVAEGNPYGCVLPEGHEGGHVGPDAEAGEAR